MPLTFPDSRSLYDHGSDIVRFRAMDGPKMVICAVSREALMDRARATEASPDDLVAVYENCASEVQRIAQRKYAANQIEADGIVLVKTAELNQI